MVDYKIINDTIKRLNDLNNNLGYNATENYKKMASILKDFDKNTKNKKNAL